MNEILEVTPRNGIVYDTDEMGALLGISVRCEGPGLRRGHSDEIVIGYGGQGIRTLFESPAGKRHIHRIDAIYGRENYEAQSGYYRLKLGDPQPVAVVLSAVLAHLVKTGQSLFHDAWLCKEGFAHGRRSAVTCIGNKIEVGFRWE